MENAIQISKINDFIFCPASIYFHMLDDDTEKKLYQSNYQLNGSKAHECIDNKTYSGRKDVLQGIDVYSEEYNLTGKIDIYDISTFTLTERKNRIINIYDGYVFQVYAEYFCLKEMGYDVKFIRLYSMIDNKVFLLKKPEEDAEMFKKFKLTIANMEKFNFKEFSADNIKKCEKCIYENLCYYSLLR